MSASRIPDMGWLLARVPKILQANGGYATDEQLADALGVDYPTVRAVIGAAYRARRLDRAAGYLVLPARPAKAARGHRGDPGRAA
jgi:hypothetical protein